MHQLIIAEPRQCPADPHKDKYKKEGFGKNHDRAHQSPHPVWVNAREMIGSKINGSNNCGGNEHVDVFGKQKEAELHGTILCVIAAYQFSFTFRQVKRRAVCLRKRTNKEYKKAQWLAHV